MTMISQYMPTFDLNESDEEDDDEIPTMTTTTCTKASTVVAPHLSSEPRAPDSLPEPPVTLDLTEPSASRSGTKRRTEWDKLTAQWFANGAASPQALPYSNARGAVPAAKHMQHRQGGELKRRRTTAPLDLTQPDTSGPIVERTSTAKHNKHAWKANDRCLAKFRAQTVGSHNAFWYPGRIASVSASGKKCDVVFDDGDREACVPLRFLRLPQESDGKGDAPRCESESDDVPPGEPGADVGNVAVTAMPEQPASALATPPPVEARAADDDETTATTALPHVPSRGSPLDDLRQKMVDLLANDMEVLGLDARAFDLGAVVDALGCNRARFRSVRFNLKRQWSVTDALARGAISVASVADLSAFSKERTVSGLPLAHKLYEVAHEGCAPEYRYRGGQYLPVGGPTEP
jgi:hypothetical protein